MRQRGLQRFVIGAVAAGLGLTLATPSLGAQANPASASCTLPKLLGLPLAKAKLWLDMAGCPAPKVTQVPTAFNNAIPLCDQQGKTGRVLSQAPAPGKRLRSGPVALSVCRPAPQVHLVYAVPSGDTGNPNDTKAIAAAITSLQSWYLAQVGKTFSIFDPTPRLCQLPRKASYYLVGTWDKLYDDLQPCAKLTYGSPSKDWVVYANVDHTCNTDGPIGLGAQGLVILGVQDLSGLISGPVSECGESFDYPVGRYIGGLGHELGHSFGLPHPPGCEDNLPTCDYNALMWAGYVSYPDTYLTAAEKRALLKSPYFWKTTASG